MSYLPQNYFPLVSSYISEHLPSFVIGVIFIRYIYSLGQKNRLPDGPIGLPLIGYLPFLGKNAHYTLWKLGEQYGPIYTLPLGAQNVVVLNDWPVVRDALRKEAFLGRPEHTSFSLVTGVKSLIDDNHANWREERRTFENLFETCFESSHVCRNVLAEIRALLTGLKKTRAQPTQWTDIFATFVNNSLNSFIFGKNILPTKSLFYSTLFVNTSILSFYSSWLGKLFYRLFDFFYQYRFRLFIKFFRSQTKNHYKTMRTETHIRDLIDGYILDMQTKKMNMLPTVLSVDKLRANCQVFLSFGNEAMLSYMEWSLITVAHHQHYQTLIAHEIRRVIGLEKVPHFNHQIRMPFTAAFLNEILRWKTVLPLNFTRRALEDGTILGIFIPKNTLVLANIWAVHHDPLIWENPFEFNPYRFLSEDEKQLIEPEGFIPFSLGKRSCVAESFVRRLVFLYFTSILQKFRIKSEENQLGRLFEDDFNMVLRPKCKCNLVFELRTNSDISQSSSLL